MLPQKIIGTLVSLNIKKSVQGNALSMEVVHFPDFNCRHIHVNAFSGREVQIQIIFCHRRCSLAFNPKYSFKMNSFSHFPLIKTPSAHLKQLNTIVGLGERQKCMIGKINDVLVNSWVSKQGNQSHICLLSSLMD